MSDSSLHHIVVVGGGAGGLELATRLGESLGKSGRARITLVDRGRTHVWKPLLHSIAAGSLKRSQDELDYLAQAHWSHFRYRNGEMIGLDRAAKTITLAPLEDEDGREIIARSSLAYDTLVVAVGSVTNDFGTPGAAKFAVPLDTPEQASRFNRRLVNAFLRAQNQHEPIRPAQLHVAIIGAGATGAELAGELHHTSREIIAYGLDKIDPERDLRIVLIEAADRILPALSPRIANAARDLLLKLGVEVRTGARVAEVLAEGVKLADGKIIPSELVIWCAGVRAPAFLLRHRRPGNQPHRPAGRAPDAADHTRRPHIRDGRLRVLSEARLSRSRAAARAGRPSDGRVHASAAQRGHRGPALARICLPRFRLAGFAR